MTSSSTLRSTLALLLALTSAPALAEHEDGKAHDHGPKRTIVLDNDDIRPNGNEVVVDDGSVGELQGISPHDVPSMIECIVAGQYLPGSCGHRGRPC